MAVCGENEFRIKALAIRVILSLLHPFEAVLVFFFCFKYSDWQRLAAIWNLDAKEIVGFARSFAATPLGPCRLHGCWSLQTDVRHAIAFGPEHGINQLIPRLSFVSGH
jgi:hypothetical protein